MARPLRVLEDMLTEIREKGFNPDATRSGRLTRGTGQASQSVPPTSGPECVKIEISDDEGELNVWELLPTADVETLPRCIPDDCENEVNDACTETSDSEDSDGGAGEDGFQTQGRMTFEPPKAPVGFTMWQHSKSKILHLSDYKFPNTFECGRKPGPFHTKEGLNPRWDTGICWRCFKNR